MNLSSYKKLDTKKKILAKILSFLAVMALLAYFVLLPTMNSISDLKQKIINAKVSIHENIEKEQNLDKLKNDLKNIEPKIDKLNAVFVNKNQELDFITAMESIAKQNNVQQELNLDTFPDEDAKFSTISLSIDAQGNFNDLMRYLKGLESAKYYLNINQLSLSLNNRDSGNEQVINSNQILNMNIKADTYFK